MAVFGMDGSIRVERTLRSRKLKIQGTGGVEEIDGAGVRTHGSMVDAEPVYDIYRKKQRIKNSQLIVTQRTFQDRDDRI